MRVGGVCEEGGVVGVSYAEDGVEPEHGLGVLVVVRQGDLLSAVHTQVLPGGHVSQSHLLFPPQNIA